MKLSELPIWREFVVPAAIILLIGILALICHHRSSSSTKRSGKFYVGLFVSMVVALGIYLTQTHETLYGASIDETINHIAATDAKQLEEVLQSMVRLSKESLASRKSSTILGTEKKRIPEAINSLSPHSINLRKGEVKILLRQHGVEALFLSLGLRGENHYILLNLQNGSSYLTEKRELYPGNRVRELLSL